MIKDGIGKYESMQSKEMVRIYLSPQKKQRKREEKKKKKKKA